MLLLGGILTAAVVVTVIASIGTTIFWVADILSEPYLEMWEEEMAWLRGFLGGIEDE